MTYKSVLTLPPRSHLSRRSLDFALLSAIPYCETNLCFRRIKSEFIRPGRKSSHFNRTPAIGSITDGSRIGSSRKSPGRCTGVSTVSETVYSKHSAIVATLDSTTSEQPQAYGKKLSETCSVQNEEPSPAKPQSESSPVNIVHSRLPAATAKAPITKLIDKNNDIIKINMGLNPLSLAQHHN